MSTPREIEGFWWFPPDQERRWFGTLLLEPETSPSLSLKSADGISAGFLFPLRPQVVHGETSRGSVTLLHPMQRSVRCSGAISTNDYHVGIAILGVHISSRQELLVNQVSLSVQNLHEWFGGTGFVQSSCGDNGMLIRHRSKELVEARLNDDLRTALAPQVSLSANARERQVSENTIWRFDSRAGLSLNACLKLQDTVRHLLHFALLRPIHLSRMVATKEGVGQQIGDRFVATEIEVWMSNMKADDQPEPIPALWVFRFADLGEDFGGAFSRWLSFCDEFAEALDCYHGTVYHRLPATIAFLSLTQALEAFQSIRQQSFRGPPHLIGKLETMLAPAASFLPDRMPDSRAYAERVKETRHYYTHHNPESLD
jgi:hypothetical protein